MGFGLKYQNAHLFPGSRVTSPNVVEVKFRRSTDTKYQLNDAFSWYFALVTQLELAQMDHAATRWAIQLQRRTVLATRVGARSPTATGEEV